MATVLIAFPAQFTFNQRESPLATLRAICLSLKSLPLPMATASPVARFFLSPTLCLSFSSQREKERRGFLCPFEAYARADLRPERSPFVSVDSLLLGEEGKIDSEVNTE